ncbi:tRNA epoxyqueuosine(34) reductase QueG [Reichenbachiella carrageenanivorans]|uniref:Epoxyqueuosine reductase n=1 Tax=Reichenbachiella carrageenanivorans TaxID=2979869 RepID=A0ABY6D304_9BACT|nr:tRNA epoxyqueuosine(34) reductase QueG [Reichenbachiella carrageenanivorans]UXX80547.1 tRNA epoxyqueuosine(34) reductase QueG [Reichenbachiella carrageenanivorans]
MNRTKLTQLIKQKSAEEGFQFCGVAKAEFLEDEAPKLENWLNQGMHGEMAYMANHFDKRLDPTKLVEGAKTVISLLYNYYPEKDLNEGKEVKIAKYAFGKDYHYIIKPKLKTVLQAITEQVGEVDARVFVDSAPVHERAWAAKAGLGWVGKNSLLINRSMGSFFFLAEIILDVELDYDGPIKDYCGTCSACMDACPTDAIPAPYVVDGSKCISYLTIELKNEIPKAFEGQMEGWAFGCDICQDVCPWNRFSKPHQEKDFAPNGKLGEMKRVDWDEMTEELFREIFKGSAVKRTKFSGLKRNLDFLKKK